MSISNWPMTERPRERLLALGPGALSDAELLAIFLRTGIRGATAIDLARSLITRFGSLTALFSASAENLRDSPGLGTAKAAQLLAIIEISRRTLGERLSDGESLTSPQAVRDYLRLSIGGRDREVFLALYLDAQHRVIHHEELFLGSLTQTSVHPREVTKSALRHNAAAAIFAHNHPSGVAEPSHADEALTQVLKQALALVEVRVLDHFVVTSGKVTSLAERGMI